MPSSLNDDVWGDGGDSEEELQREGRAREQHFHTAGFLDGVEQGKQRSVQLGFTVGFQEGMHAGFQWGMLQGAVRTLQAFSTSILEPSEVDELVRRFDSVTPRAVSLSAFQYILQQPFPSARVTTCLDAEVYEAAMQLSQEDGLELMDAKPEVELFDFQEELLQVQRKLAELGYTVGSPPAVPGTEPSV